MRSPTVTASLEVVAEKHPDPSAASDSKEAKFVGPAAWREAITLAPAQAGDTHEETQLVWERATPWIYTQLNQFRKLIESNIYQEIEEYVLRVGKFAGERNIHYHQRNKQIWDQLKEQLDKLIKESERKTLLVKIEYETLPQFELKHRFFEKTSLGIQQISEYGIQYRQNIFALGILFYFEGYFEMRKAPHASCYGQIFLRAIKKVEDPRAKACVELIEAEQEGRDANIPIDDSLVKSTKPVPTVVAVDQKALEPEIITAAQNSTQSSVDETKLVLYQTFVISELYRAMQRAKTKSKCLVLQKIFQNFIETSNKEWLAGLGDTEKLRLYVLEMELQHSLDIDFSGTEIEIERQQKVLAIGPRIMAAVRRYDFANTQALHDLLKEFQALNIDPKGYEQIKLLIDKIQAIVKKHGYHNPPLYQYKNVRDLLTAFESLGSQAAAGCKVLRDFCALETLVQSEFTPKLPVAKTARKSGDQKQSGMWDDKKYHIQINTKNPGDFSAELKEAAKELFISTISTDNYRMLEVQFLEADFNSNVLRVLRSFGIKINRLCGKENKIHVLAPYTAAETADNFTILENFIQQLQRLAQQDVKLAEHLTFTLEMFRILLYGPKDYLSPMIVLARRGGVGYGRDTLGREKANRFLVNLRKKETSMLNLGSYNTEVGRYFVGRSPEELVYDASACDYSSEPRPDAVDELFAELSAVAVESSGTAPPTSSDQKDSTTPTMTDDKHIRTVTDSMHSDLPATWGSRSESFSASAPSQVFAHQPANIFRHIVNDLHAIFYSDYLKCAHRSPQTFPDGVMGLQDLIRKVFWAKTHTENEIKELLHRIDLKLQDLIGDKKQRRDPRVQEFYEDLSRALSNSLQKGGTDVVVKLRNRGLDARQKLSVLKGKVIPGKKALCALDGKDFKEILTTTLKRYKHLNNSQACCGSCLFSCRVNWNEVVEQVASRGCVDLTRELFAICNGERGGGTYWSTSFRNILKSELAQRVLEIELSSTQTEIAELFRTVMNGAEGSAPKLSS